MKKYYPKTEDNWIEYLTVENYFTFNEIEYRKNKILQNSCDFNKIFNSITKYREENRDIIFKFKENKFYFIQTEKLKKRIDEINSFFKNTSYFFKDKYKADLLKESLIYESYYSSTIEGAHSTVDRIKILAEKNEFPKNKDETMILNNLNALLELENKKEKLDHFLIKKIHSIITKDLLKIEDVGEYRRESNVIINHLGKVIFRPPKDIKFMNAMLDEFLNFLEFHEEFNGIYKAITFHFIFAYIHPFIDGNGRTVRVLFNYLLKSYGYDMFYYISLSEMIYKKERKGYYKAFIDVERSDISGKKF